MKKTKTKRLVPDIITPNKITVARIFLIPLFIIFFYQSFAAAKIIAACFFTVAAFTDFLDGYVARKYNVVTAMGKFLDPIADKVLVSTAFILLLTDRNFMFGNWMSDGNFPWLPAVMGVMVAVILARELIISGFREIAAEKRIVLAANMLGKVKTTVQDVAIVVLLLAVALRFSYGVGEAGLVVFIVGFVLLCVAAILTVVSGIMYVVTNREVFSDRRARR